MAREDRIFPLPDEAEVQIERIVHEVGSLLALLDELLGDRETFHRVLRGFGVRRQPRPERQYTVTRYDDNTVMIYGEPPTDDAPSS